MGGGGQAEDGVMAHLDHRMIINDFDGGGGWIIYCLVWVMGVISMELWGELEIYTWNKWDHLVKKPPRTLRA